MRSQLESLLVAALLAATVFSSGCEDSTSPGTLVVDWKVSTSCTAIGVSDVVVKVLFAGTQDEYESQRVQCDQMTVTFAHVTPGTYDLRLLGIDAKGTELYVGDLASVSVSDGSTTKVPQPILLSQKKGAIDLAWEFESGLCGSNSVASVQIALFDPASNLIYEEELAEPFPCDPVGLTAAERTIGKSPDPAYVPAGILIGDLNQQEYVVHVFGLDAAGNKVRKGMVTIPVKRGEVSAEILQLVTCTSTKYPDLQCN